MLRGLRFPSINYQRFQSMNLLVILFHRVKIINAVFVFFFFFGGGVFGGVFLVFCALENIK
jgi:hypothetical protein